MAADDARAIFAAAVAAVDSSRLVRQAVQVDEAGQTLAIGEAPPLGLGEVDRLLVVGGGKAGVGMLRGWLDALPPAWRSRCEGWINVPADCVPSETLHPAITVHAAREAGVNEPQAAGVVGTHHILKLVATAGPRDVVVVLLSGGGSALLPAPRGVSLEQKQQLVRQLSRGGATITQLNAVRRQLSLIKGGGLAAACRAGAMHVLTVSDVIGDDWATIASGPTTPPADDAVEQARAVLGAFAIAGPVREAALAPKPPATIATRLHHHLIGSNCIAVAAAAAAARERGYDVVRADSGRAGEAASLGRDLLAELRTLRDESPRRRCVVDGGEPVVDLPASPGRGGRNQHLVLAALASQPASEWERLTLLSGGTDGEDGATDAAGGVVDAAITAAASSLDLAATLAAGNSYEALAACEALLHTGPTHTNVMDVRIGLVSGH